MTLAELQELLKRNQSDLKAWEACGGYEPQLMTDPEEMVRLLTHTIKVQREHAVLYEALIAAGVNKALVDKMLEEAHAD